jgi:precorrin-4 methylase
MVPLELFPDPAISDVAATLASAAIIATAGKVWTVAGSIQETIEENEQRSKKNKRRSKRNERLLVGDPDAVTSVFEQLKDLKEGR